MESRNTERQNELPNVETPEDVAVLYSWANLHGAKYRDFSASRREYRAQLRHRAAEQVREQELRAQANAETAASLAERTARRAEEVAMSNQARETEQTHLKALREAEEAARVANAERIEAARRAEAAALAEAAARREEREIVEASASARRQAAQYADSEVRRRQAEDPGAEPKVPGEISDPYTPQNQTPGQLQAQLQVQARQSPPVQAPPALHLPPQHPSSHPAQDRPASIFRTDPLAAVSEPAYAVEPVYTVPPQQPLASPVEYASAPQPELLTPVQPSRRPQGYRPDDASGVRQIYRGPEFEAPRDLSRSQSTRRAAPSQAPPAPPARDPRVRTGDYAGLDQASRQDQAVRQDQAARQDQASRPEQRPWTPPPARPQARPDRASAWSDGLAAPLNPSRPTSPAPPRLPSLYASGQAPSGRPESVASPSQNGSERSLQDPTPRRRRQDSPEYKQEHPSDSGSLGRRQGDAAYRAPSPQPPVAPSRRPPAIEDIAPRADAPAPEPSGPAWLYASPAPIAPIPAPLPPAPQSSVAETLQHSRERVASRWYALKGVFEQPGQEPTEPSPVRQKETRTPILAVFSLAGGVGKTSIVATLGRSLSSLGEKVLLTDTTSHGLLPFYFGASELRQGTVRTFSPPSGSTDAPIYLVSYDVEQKAADEAAQEALVEGITASSRGTHRVLLDLSVSSGWILRRIARLSPTVLIPVAPDMNSVISLGAVEKFFEGVVDAEGRPIKLFFLLNQFDASLPLHLDIREVLRRQLGDRPLPFVVRRAPAVGEALAEGMTIVDYSPEASVAEDYLNAATWLRTVAAPATSGFRNVRWSER